MIDTRKIAVATQAIEQAQLALGWLEKHGADAAGSISDGIFVIVDTNLIAGSVAGKKEAMGYIGKTINLLSAVDQAVILARAKINESRNIIVNEVA